MFRISSTFPCLVVFLLWPAVVLGQDGAPAPLDIEADASNCILGNSDPSEHGKDRALKHCLSKDDITEKLDLTAPANPLFTLMGSSPETVIKPTPGEKLTVSFLPELVDAFGNEQTGFAVEIRPSLFFLPKRFTISELGGVSVSGLKGCLLYTSPSPRDS